MSLLMIVQFLVLFTVCTGLVIFFLKRTLFNSTEGAVRRLDAAVEENKKKQAELNQKIKEADEELTKRKKEADELAQKMIEDAEAKAKEERDKMIQHARTEGEDIISKAQRTKEQVRAELEKDLAIKSINHATAILALVLSEKSRGMLDNQLIDEFLESLKEVDMAQVGDDVTTADIVTASEIAPDKKSKIEQIIKDKLKRAITVNATTDPGIVGGVVLRFGSLALDGSLQNQFSEASVALKQKAERGEQE